MTTVVLSGALANKAGEGGSAWIILSWLGGLRALGLDVHLVEQLGPAAWVDAQGAPSTFEASAGRAFFRHVVETAGYAGRATLIAGDGPLTDGLPFADLHDLVREADLLLNLSGHLRIPSLLARCRQCAYVDLDPGFTQVWHSQGLLGRQLEEHHVLFTVGQNVGTARSAIPTGGLTWHPIRQPVVLEEWPALPGPTAATPGPEFSTVAHWRPPHGPIEHGGRRHGTRPHVFRRFLDLPSRVEAAAFELALAIDGADAADRQALRAAGWGLVPPADVTSTPAAFQTYVQRSGAELSIPQEAYASLQTGWLGDRSTRYLASGRPVLALDTGLGASLPTDEGLVTFTTLDAAAAGAARILADYDRHARAARQIAERHFEATSVLRAMLGVADLGG